MFDNPTCTWCNRLWFHAKCHNGLAQKHHLKALQSSMGFMHLLAGSQASSVMSHFRFAPHTLQTGVCILCCCLANDWCASRKKHLICHHAKHNALITFSLVPLIQVPQHACFKATSSDNKNTNNTAPTARNPTWKVPQHGWTAMMTAMTMWRQHCSALQQQQKFCVQQPLFCCARMLKSPSIRVRGWQCWKDELPTEARFHYDHNGLVPQTATHPFSKGNSQVWHSASTIEWPNWLSMALWSSCRLRHESIMITMDSCLSWQLILSADDWRRRRF